MQHMYLICIGHVDKVILSRTASHTAVVKSLPSPQPLQQAMYASHVLTDGTFDMQQGVPVTFPMTTGGAADLADG